MINVLDHGFVRLVDHMGDDMSIVRAARVSYNAEKRTGEDAGKDEKLIRYLMSHKHTSPFEAVTFTFEVKAPIFVFRQWHRHRTASYNEVSARYSELPEEFYVPAPEQVGVQSRDNKQMRVTDGEARQDADAFNAVLRANSERCFNNYHTALRHGIPRELARCMLPLNTYSHMFVTLNLHNLLHFLKLRLHEHAQYEIRVYADAMMALIEPIVPMAISAFEGSRNG